MTSWPEAGSLAMCAGFFSPAARLVVTLILLLLSLPDWLSCYIVDGQNEGSHDEGFSLCEKIKSGLDRRFIFNIDYPFVCHRPITSEECALISKPGWIRYRLLGGIEGLQATYYKEDWGRGSGDFQEIWQSMWYGDRGKGLRHADAQNSTTVIMWYIAMSFGNKNKQLSVWLLSSN